MPATSSGRVSIVGAGPGDPGLLTLRAAELLGAADVLLYDALVAPAVLDLAARDCERVFVGKRGGRPSMPQAEIEARMVREAAAGKHVVRLKGGDPFVFGRGAEEAQTLHAAGIAFEIVPGITSAIAAPAYAGIPVTHRAHNTAVTIATGHEDPGKAGSTLDWERLADPHRTLVLLMAIANLEDIARELLAHGLAPDTPAAVVHDGTRPTQRTVVATLATIASAVRDAAIGSPAVLIVGNVVRVRDEVRWYETRPLFGRRVLVTRPQPQADEFAHRLAARGAIPMLAPVLQIEPPDDPQPAIAALADLARYDWIAFTSQRGVEAFFARLAETGRDARALGGARVAAIGPVTAAELARYGIFADAVAKTFVGEGVATAIVASARSRQRVLIYRAQEARDALPQALRDAGLAVDVVAGYRSAPVADPDFASKVRDAEIVTFTSAGCVRAAIELLGGNGAARDALQGKIVACIGPIAAAAAGDAGIVPQVVAGTFTTDGLIAALEANLHP